MICLYQPVYGKPLRTSFAAQKGKILNRDRRRSGNPEMDAPVFPYGEFGKSKGVNFEMERLRYVGTGVSARTLAIIVMAVAVALLNTNAHGGLMLGPNQLGTKQTISPDGAVEINLNGFNGLFFGKDVSSIWLAENGYMSLTDVTDTDFFPESFSTNTAPRIANFWDDIFDVSKSPGARAEQGIFFSRQPGQYVAATWSQVFLANDFAADDFVTDDFARSFQTVWFEADTRLADFQFKKDDIAMGFSGLSAGSIDATVGIRDKSQVFTINDVAGPNNGRAPGGVISTNFNDPKLNNADLLPWADDKILLFRPEVDTNGHFSGYRVSIETITAIPEPNSLALLGAGTCLFYWFRKRQRKNNKIKSRVS